MKCLSYQAAHPVADPTQAVWDALKAPVGSLPLAEIARGRTSACVVISDVTRPVPNRMILPPILATLEEQGIPRSQILILIATGLHRPNLGDELTEMLGPGDRRAIPGGKPSRTRVGGAHVPGRKPARHSRLDRREVSCSRPEDHDRPDRAAFHGRFLRRAASSSAPVWPLRRRSCRGMARGS